MQSLALSTAVACAIALPAMADYTNYLRQIQYPTGVMWDVNVESEGQSQSPLPLDTEGSRFELWTVDYGGNEPVSYLLDHKFVAAFDITSEIEIITEDTEARFPRTRADRPFEVTVNVSGLLAQADDQGASQVKLLRHVQSYGEKGTPASVDPDQATLLTQAVISNNGEITLSYPITSIPGDDRTKIRGEERFSVFTVDTEEQIASGTVKIWPVADGSIAGISSGEKIRFKSPQLTITLNDLYPSSTTYAQVYKGPASLGTEGTPVPGTSLTINQEVPEDRVLIVEDWDKVIAEDGIWTMELLTSTPFGIDRLYHVTFEVDRTITVKGMVTTQE